MQGGPFGENFFFRKKSLAVPKKNERGESLVSPGMVCYAEKQEKPFWFSSLDQIVHFDAIIFCRTFVELFWSVRVDRKKRVTIIVAFHFMKRRLKTNGILMISEIVRLHFVSWRIHLITTPILYDVPPIGLRVRFFVAVAPPMVHCLVNG